MSKISYEEALNKLQNLNITTRTKKVFIIDSLDEILAQDIKAQTNSPAYPTAAMDGYAINISSNPSNKEFKIVDYSPAGSVVDTQVNDNVCIKTFTGSLMPKGSDTLVPIENIKLLENNTISITQEVPCGFAVMRVGENYEKNEILIPKGSKIDFAQIGVMASLNIVFVEVYDSPVIGICSTGSEILDIGEESTNVSQIRSSNHLTIQAIAHKYGCNTKLLGLIKDDKTSILNAISNGLNCCDIVVTTGGVSVGDYDFVKDIVIDQLGAEVVFQGVEIKPGQHIIVAQLGNKFICALPGFAYSSTVTFLLFCLPVIFKYRGNYEKLNIINAIASNQFHNPTSKTVFTASNISYQDGSYYVDTRNKKIGTSAILTNLLGNSVLAISEPKSFIDSNQSIKTIIL